LSYDNNGNLTDDGVFKYGYDAWNRLVETTRRVDAYTTVATYAFDGQNRRTQKAVTNSGILAAAHDGGDEAVHYFYSNQWQILETRNGSDQSTAQYVWGSMGGAGVSPARYVDELVFADLNGDPAEHNDCNPDATGSDPNDASPDRRYFLHQDRNWNVVAATESGGDGVGTDGRVAERYGDTPYGEFIVLKGDAGSGELGQVLPASGIANLFFRQGLPFEEDKGSYQNRHREYPAALQRFAQRDPICIDQATITLCVAQKIVDRGEQMYAYAGSLPVQHREPTGLMVYKCNAPTSFGNGHHTWINITKTVGTD